MNFYWIYNIPNWLMFVAIVSTITVITVIAVSYTVKWSKKTMGLYPGENDLVNVYYSSIGVFYGITLGLIAVGAWNSFTTISDRTDSEAAALGAMYRIADNYQEPTRSELKADLKDYNYYIINEAWKLQQRGEIPTAGIPKILKMQKAISTYEPQTTGQSNLHVAGLRKFDELTQLSRMRLLNIGSGLPAVLWWVVFSGAGINIFMLCLLIFRSLRTHILLSTLVSVMMGLLISMTIALDHPFRGEVSISSASFQNVYDTLMK